MNMDDGWETGFVAVGGDADVDGDDGVLFKGSPEPMRVWDDLLKIGRSIYLSHVTPGRHSLGRIADPPQSHKAPFLTSLLLLFRFWPFHFDF